MLRRIAKHLCDFIDVRCGYHLSFVLNVKQRAVAFIVVIGIIHYSNCHCVNYLHTHNRFEHCAAVCALYQLHCSRCVCGRTHTPMYRNLRSF